MTGGGIDISAADLAIVQDILRQHVPDREVWAFGSRVTGKARPFSDLDLCVVGKTPLPLAVAAALSEAFSESDLPFKVDVVDWGMTSERFRAIIAGSKIILKPGR
jgi:predicted nucleotidyltransferase